MIQDLLNSYIALYIGGYNDDGEFNFVKQYLHQFALSESASLNLIHILEEQRNAKYGQDIYAIQHHLPEHFTCLLALNKSLKVDITNNETLNKYYDIIKSKNIINDKQLIEYVNFKLNNS